MPKQVIIIIERVHVSRASFINTHVCFCFFSVKAGGMRIVQHKNVNSAADKVSAAAADEANSVLKVSTR